jgi:hypothetical protein
MPVNSTTELKRGCGQCWGTTRLFRLEKLARTILEGRLVLGFILILTTHYSETSLSHSWLTIFTWNVMNWKISVHENHIQWVTSSWINRLCWQWFICRPSKFPLFSLSYLSTACFNTHCIRHSVRWNFNWKKCVGCCRVSFQVYPYVQRQCWNEAARYAEARQSCCAWRNWPRLFWKLEVVLELDCFFLNQSVIGDQYLIGCIIVTKQFSEIVSMMILVTEITWTDRFCWQCLICSKL